MMTRYILLFIVFCASSAIAQDESKPRISPLDVVSARHKSTYVKIVYSQPQKKGREIFGKLVPYGQVWRTGANEATEITITKDILMSSIHIKAGTYSLFTIPGKDKWIIILNADLGMWGSYNYNQKQDVIRFTVPAKEAATVYEPFTIMFDQKNEMADLLLLWDKTKVAIPVKFIN